MAGHAFVTGGHTGIGLAVARALSGAGHAVTVASIDAEGDGAVHAAMAALGPRAGYVRLDVAALDAHGPALDRAEAERGPITTLVSNAGVAQPRRGDMLDLDPHAFDHVMGVNLRGGFFLAQAVARRMVGRDGDGYRCLIFVTSVSAAMASPERAAYAISKAGAAAAARHFALRLAPRGIGVFDLRPGIIETAMTAGVRGAYDARIERGLVPAGRWGAPEDVAAVALAVAEGRMAFATGAVLPVDGGLSIARL